LYTPLRNPNKNCDQSLSILFLSLSWMRIFIKSLIPLPLTQP